MSVTSTTKVKNYTYAIQADNYLINTDVSEKLGGNALAPDPHQYLEIALAGCTVITIEMYAKRKNIPLESVDVKITILEEGKENKMRRDIDFKGDLSNEDKQKLLEIAEKCPIHHFLTRGTKIETCAI